MWELWVQPPQLVLLQRPLRWVVQRQQLAPVVLVAAQAPRAEKKQAAAPWKGLAQVVECPPVASQLVGPEVTTPAVLPPQQRWKLWDGAARGPQVAAEVGAGEDGEVGAAATAVHVLVTPSAGAWAGASAKEKGSVPSTQARKDRWAADDDMVIRMELGVDAGVAGTFEGGGRDLRARRAEVSVQVPLEAAYDAGEGDVGSGMGVHHLDGD